MQSVVPGHSLFPASVEVLYPGSGSVNLELGCCAQSARAEGKWWGKPGGSQSLQRDWIAEGRRGADRWLGPSPGQRNSAS